MKRNFYILAFMFLGYLISFLVHALIEIPVLGLVAGAPGAYGDNIIWLYCGVIHGTAGVFLSFGGIILGWFLGRKFWQILYVEQHYGEPRW